MRSFYIVKPHTGLVITELWLKNKGNSPEIQVLDKELQPMRTAKRGASPLPGGVLKSFYSVTCSALKPYTHKQQKWTKMVVFIYLNIHTHKRTQTQADTCTHRHTPNNNNQRKEDYQFERERDLGGVREKCCNYTLIKIVNKHP